MAKRQRRFDDDIEDEIERLALEGLGGAAILRELKRNSEFAMRELPSLRTIQDIVRDFHRDGSGQWSLTDSRFSSEANHVVLTTLAAVMFHTQGVVANITNDEARWVVRIIRASPHITTWNAWRVARLYITRAQLKLPADDLDFFLAVEPWRSTDLSAAYRDATLRGWAPVVPGFLLSDEDGYGDRDSIDDIARWHFKLARRWQDAGRDFERLSNDSGASKTVNE